MLSSFFIDHLPHVFFGSLGIAFLVGLARAAGPQRPAERVARLFGGLLVYYALLMTVAHLASFARPTRAPAMAVALVSPASRLTAVRKLGLLIRESEKSERTVEELVALDLAVHDCQAAESDAYRYRARSSWPKVTAACGASESAARALYEDGRLEEAAAAFERARVARPGAWMEIDELTAYVMTKHVALAVTTLRAMKPKGAFAGDLACLADAIATYAGSSTRWGPPSGSRNCEELGMAFVFAGMPPNPPVTERSIEPQTCVPHRNTLRQMDEQRSCVVDRRFTFKPGELVPFATEEHDGRAARAQWLFMIDDSEGALAVADRELARYTWNAPLYPDALRQEHEALIDAAKEDAPGNIWIRADCAEEIRVPAGHPLAKRVAKDRKVYDPARDHLDQENLRGREETLAWAYSLAVESLDGARAKEYLARAAPEAEGAITTFNLDRRLPLLLAFSSESASRYYYPLEPGLREAAIAGSGTRLANRLRELDGSGANIIDVIGKTIPEGRAALASFSRYQAHLDCERRRVSDSPKTQHCTAFSLVRALGTQHRVARAVGDEATERESRESLDRILGYQGGAWLQDRTLGPLLGIAGLMLAPPEPPSE